MNIAIVLSGGTGSRMGLDIPKQYLKVCDKPVIKYSMDTILGCEKIDAVHVVADASWQELIKDCVEAEYMDKFKGFSVPGENRQLSIYNALRDISEYADEKDRVIVHDAARPFLKEQTLVDLISALDDFDGAIPVLPMKDTVYLSKDGHIESLLERSAVVAGQAPESFLFGKYLAANEALLPEKIKHINGSTEPAYLYGMSIKCIPGDEGNYKITTIDDLKRWQGEGV